MNIPEIKPAGQESYDGLLKERNVLAEYISLQSQMHSGVASYEVRDKYHALHFSGVITKIMAKLYPAKPAVDKPRERKKSKQA